MKHLYQLDIEVPPRHALSVWLTGQRAPATQLALGPYAPETAHDARRIPPAVAAYAIAAYTLPGDTVLDPDCGAGTVLVEAVRLRRRATGLTNQRWWPLAHTNLTAAHRSEHRPVGAVFAHTPTAVDTVRAGRPAELILTSLRSPGRRSAHSSHRIAPQERWRSLPPLHEVLAEYREVLAPGGHVILVDRPVRNGAGTPDAVGRLIRTGQAAGLRPVERAIALQAEVRGSRLIPRASLAQRRYAARHKRTTGHPLALTAHHEVLVFQAPERHGAAAAVRLPPDDRPPQPRRTELTTTGRVAA